MKLLKRIGCCFLVICFLTFSMESNIPNVLASQKNSVSDSKYLSKMIKLQKKNHTKKSLQKDVEEKLNTEGVFDSELEDLTDNDIKNLNDATDINVSTEYVVYYEPINEDKNNTYDDNISTNDKINKNSLQSHILTPSEIDEVIKEKYFTDEFGENSKNTNVLDVVASMIGLQPQAAYASEHTSYKNSTYMKKTLISSQVGDYNNISYTCTWLKEPDYRLVDSMVLSYNGGTMVTSSGTYNAKFTYTQKNLGESANSKVVNLTSYLYNKRKPGLAAIAFKLPDDVYNTRDDVYVTRNYNMRATMSFKLNVSGKGCELAGEYDHQKKKISIDLLGGVELGASAIAFVLTDGASLAVNVITGVGATAGTLNLFKTSSYFENVGSAVQLSYQYK